MWGKLALFTGLVLCAHAQNGISNATSGPWTAELNGTWRWHVGDDLRWAAPSYDDSSWQSLSIPGQPPNAARYWIRIPVLLGKVADPAIMIGGIAYGYELYWDGERIGNLGHDAPDAQWFTPRPLIFSIPSHLATSGHHVVAVRVFDGHTRLFVGLAKLLPRENRVGSFSVLNDIETADWSRLMQARSTELLIDLVLALTGVYFLLLPRSTAGGLTFRWFGACLLFRGLFVLCQFYQHLGPPVTPPEFSTGLR